MFLVRSYEGLQMCDADMCEFKRVSNYVRLTEERENNIPIETEVFLMNLHQVKIVYFMFRHQERNIYRLVLNDGPEIEVIIDPGSAFYFQPSKDTYPIKFK